MSKLMNKSFEELLMQGLDKLETQETCSEQRSLEEKFFQVMDAPKVRVLYDMDFTLDELEEILKDTELYLRKAEKPGLFASFFERNIVNMPSQRNTHVVL